VPPRGFACTTFRLSRPGSAGLGSSAYGDMADGEGLPALRSGCLAALGSNCILIPVVASSSPDGEVADGEGLVA
jgi:hypothetical protein